MPCSVTSVRPALPTCPGPGAVESRESRLSERSIVGGRGVAWFDSQKWTVVNIM